MTFPTTDASLIYHESSTADYARSDATPSPESLAEAMKSAVLITSRIMLPSILIVDAAYGHCVSSA